MTNAQVGTDRRAICVAFALLFACIGSAQAASPQRTDGGSPEEAQKPSSAPDGAGTKPPAKSEALKRRERLQIVDGHAQVNTDQEKARAAAAVMDRPDRVLARDGQGERIDAANISRENPGTARALETVVAVGDDTHFFCTGTLISADVVLTARHCEGATRIALGLSTSDPDFLIPVVGSIESPDDGVDLRILILRRPAAILPAPLRRTLAAPSGTVMIAGYGANETSGRLGFGRKRANLLKADEGWGCSGPRSHAYGCDAQHQLLIVDPGGSDTCDGDSGGPVFEFGGNGLRLIGVTSKPVAGARARCGTGGIYERVDRSAAWLDSVIEHSNEGGGK